jgi:DNA polymerase-3 subunit chi
VKVEFHFNVEHRAQYACRLVRKARAQGCTVLAVCADPRRLARFDIALWTFSALDFLPHVAADSPLAARTPILLAADGASAPARDVLLMLDDAVPEGFETWADRFARIVEVVSRADDDRQAARERFRAYRARGCEPQSFDVGQPAP